jgi:phosphate-selective porin OprO/OprP
MTAPARFSRTLLTAATVALCCGVAHGALAQAISTAPTQSSGISQEQALALTARLDALEAQNNQLEAQILDLKSQTAGNVQAIRETQAAQPTVSLSNGRPTFTSPDGNFKFAVRSVAQFDAAHYEVKPLTAANDLVSGTNFRRVRLGIEGTAYKDWSYGLWGEFGGSGGETPVLNQAYVEYSGFKPFGVDDFRIRAGAWATPAGLEDATSNTEELFLERGAAAELVRGLAAGDGRAGVGVIARGPAWYASATWTGKVVGVPATAEFNQQSGFVVRAAYNLLHGPDYDVHIGGSIQGIITPADTAAGAAVTEAVRLQERPELRVSGTRLVDTGAIASDGETSYGLEGGASFRNLYAAGEWYKIDVSRTGASAFDPSFSGWYLQGAWDITGEHRVWSNANGGFNGIKPAKPFNLSKGDWGAWEVAARYSVLDLNDRAGIAGVATPAGGIRGGDQKITTVGLNWYPNSFVRFLLDYQWARVNRLSATGSSLGEHVDVVSFRSQFAF